MKKVNIAHGKQIIIAGDFNLFFDSNLEARGDKTILKEKSVARMVEKKGRILVICELIKFAWYFKMRSIESNQ